MNTSIRKSGNQFRDTFPQYGIPPQSGHTLRDGMNYQPLNSVPLVAAQTAGNAPPQPSQYVHGTPLQTSAVASGITVNAHGLTQHGGIATSTPTVLSLPNQHSQGPTPASTPPAAPNDPKTTAHYPQQTSYHPNNMNFTAFNQAPTTRMFYPRAAPHSQNNRTIPHMPGARQPPIFTSYPNHYMPIPLIAASPMAPPNNSTVMTTVSPYANEQYQNYFALQQNASSPNYSIQGYANVRPPAAGNVRTTNQAPVYSNSMVAPTLYTSPVNQMAHYQHQQQQQPQQPQQPAKAPTKDRKNRIKIVDPVTGKEVNFGDTEQQQNDKTTEKNEDTETNASHVRVEFATEVSKRASEPSTIVKKESSPANVVNGTDKSASAATPATTTPTYLAQSKTADYKPATVTPLQTSGGGQPAIVNSLQNAVFNDNSNSIEAQVVNSNNKSSANAAAANASQSKQPMDYKRPTREESSPTPASSTTAIPVAATATTAEPVPATTKPSPSWPEPASGAQPSVASTTGPKLPAGGAPSAASVVAGVKKIPKDGAGAEPSSLPVAAPTSVGSSQSSTAAAAPSLTPSQDGLKAPSVTSTVVLDDSNESSSASAKKTPATAKQGTAAADEADSASVKQHQPQTALPQAGKFASPATASSQSLPFAAGQPAGTPTAAAVAAAPASSPAPAKPDPKATSSSAAPQQKPSSGALQTSGPISEKPSPIATPPAPFGQPFPSKTAAADKNVATNAKDDKAANPSAKTKNRSKENTEPNVVVDQNAKKSTPQSAPPAKPAQSVANAPVTASKQANGEAPATATAAATADAQAGAEGKSKKGKKSSKKEMINKKGSEKEGSDMDVFTTEKPSSPPEKSRNAEKVPAATAAQITNNTTANRSSKTNSSQKPIDDKEDISAVESDKGLVTHQNIPSTQTVPTSDSQKTEQTVAESRPRKYAIQFLLSLRDLPQCKKSIKLSKDLPGNLYSDAPFAMAKSQSAYNTMSSNNFMMPAFMNPVGRNSMSSVPPNRKSQQGRPKNDRQSTIHVTLSLKDDVPLRSSKDAWKPARLNPDMRALSADEKKTQELYKSVTGILNKLTPEKFDHLIEKIKNLPIDNVPRLQGVIDLIFDKAIDEPGFCKWYAEMCRVMQNVTVPDKDGGKMQTFRILLINKCQQQFERDKAEELDVIKKQEEIDACTDPEKKKELQLLLEYTERKVRRKSVGNCRFIGELFKLQMLTAKIMIRCIAKLLGSTDEESLECLCKLLTTIGKDLESKLAPVQKKELEGYFDKMHDLSVNKKHKVSSRIRFMLQDVIDLRRNQWVPRREADNPKKIEQINAEHERKEQEIKMMNLQQPQRGRGGDDHFNNRNRDFNKKGTRTGSQNDDEWKTVQKNSNYKPSNYKIDATKLFIPSGSSTQTQVSDSLGPAGGGFKHWGCGVAASSKPTDKRVSNSFPTSSLSMDKSLSSNNRFSRNSSSNRVTPSSSMEKPKLYPSRDASETGKISRSGSSHSIPPSSRESSIPRQQTPSRNASQNARQSTTSSAPSLLSEDELKRAAVTIFQEYDSNNDLRDSVESFEERFNPKQMPDAVRDIMAYIIENRPKSAAKCGVFIVNVINRGCVTKSHFIEAVKFFDGMAEDLIIDCPNMWISLAELTNPLIAEDCLQFNDLQTDMPKSPLLKLVKTQSEIPVDKDSILRKYLLDCLKADNSDEIIKWIDANFENSRNSPTLVSKLTTIICKIIENEWQNEGKEADESSAIEGAMKKYGKLFKIYIENKSDLEMQCLLAVHDFVAKASYPRGFIQKIFELLYDLELVSYDSFIQWSTTPTVGVAMGSLRQFFAFLADTQQSEENANH